MRTATLLVLLLAASPALSQTPARDARTPEPARRERAPLATPDDLEPAVDVGRTRIALAQRPESPTPPVTAPAPPPGPAAPAAAAPAPVAQAETVSKPPVPAVPAPRTSSPRALDSIDLGTTSITGNQELPKVLYIVPWKKSDLGDLVGRPVNTLLDEVLAPVDPEVFERHLEYYDALYGKKGQQE